MTAAAFHPEKYELFVRAGDEAMVARPPRPAPPPPPEILARTRAKESRNGRAHARAPAPPLPPLPPPRPRRRSALGPHPGPSCQACRRSLAASSTIDSRPRAERRHRSPARGADCRPPARPAARRGRWAWSRVRSVGSARRPVHPATLRGPRSYKFDQVKFDVAHTRTEGS